MKANTGIPEVGEAFLTKPELAPYLATLVQAALDLAQAAGGSELVHRFESGMRYHLLAEAS